MRFFLFAVIFHLTFFGVSAQSKSDSTTTITWTKYIILNEKNQILLRFDKNFKDWELPGCGYDGPISFKNLMDSLSIYIGFNYKDYKLSGLFSYSKPGKYRAIIKPYFIARFNGYRNSNSFNDTINTKWMALDLAIKSIPYPTMTMILEQLTKFPEFIWGGSFQEYNYNQPGGTKWKIIEPLYKLN